MSAGSRTGRGAADDPLVRTVAETLLDLRYDTWGFGESVAFEAMLVAGEALHDPRYAAFAHGYARAWAARSTPFRRLDCTAPGHAMVELVERTDDGHLLEALVSLADYLCARPRLGDVFATWESSPLMHPYGPGQLRGRDADLLASPPAGVFVDCLHFDPPFLVALGALTGADHLWREGLNQAAGYVRGLQRPDGLFDHFYLAGEPQSFGPRWGRGQGWALLGMLDVLRHARRCPLTPEDRAVVELLSDASARLVEAMLAAQREDGHWTAVVGDAASGVETSTAAFMCVGLHRAMDLGLPVPASARAAAERAGRATRRSVGPDGTVAEVSAAVMACTEPSHYAHVPRGFRVAWGQGPALLALARDT